MTAALLLSCFFILSCENDENTLKKINKKDVGVEEAREVIVNYTLGGKTKAILKAPLMYNVQAATPYVEFPQKLHTDFYNETGKIESILDAKYAKYTQNQNVVFLKDSIVVINLEKGDTLYCQELYWDKNKSGTEFYTDKPVRIRTKTETINGMGMEANQNFKNWHIIQTVGNVKIPADKFPG